MKHHNMQLLGLALLLSVSCTESKFVDNPATPAPNVEPKSPSANKNKQNLAEKIDSSSDDNSGAVRVGGPRTTSPATSEPTSPAPSEPTSPALSTAPTKTQAPASIPPETEIPPQLKPQTPAPTQSISPIPVQPVSPPNLGASTGNSDRCLMTPSATTAYVNLAVTVFANMEQGYHVLEEGSIFQIVENGAVVVAGYSTIDAVRNGQPTDGQGAYPGVILRLEATYAPNPHNGTGLLYMCPGIIGVEPQKSTCVTTTSVFPGVPGRPKEVLGQQISWTIKSGFGLLEGKNSDIPNIDINSGNIPVSAYHPVFAAAVPGAAFNDFQSPLVFDLDHNGKFDLIDVWDEQRPVRFDLMATGTKGRTGWVLPSDGFLVLDINGNGQIDSGIELFGPYSQGPKPPGNNADGSAAPSFDNGFLALAQFDDNQDGVINEQDKIYEHLRIWRDLNSNGLADNGELFTLKQMNIKEISLKYMENKRIGQRFVANNEIRIMSTYKTFDGREYGVADVWFKQRRYTDGQVAQRLSIKSK